MLQRAADFLLSLVLPFAQPLENTKPRLLRIRNRKRLGRIKCGPYSPYWFLARGTIRQRLRRKRAVQRELTAADRAAAFTNFVLIQWHN